MKNEIIHNRERLALVSSRTQLRLSLKKFIEDSKKEYQAKMNKILRDACASIPSFKSISVMTLDGKIVASTDASVLGKDASNMEAFVQGKIRHRVDILFLEDERLWLHLAGPLNLDDKKIGVIVIRTEPNSILSAMEDYSVVHKTSEILLAKEDEDGNALFLAPLRFDASAAFRKTVSNSNKNSTIIRALNKQEKVMIDTKDYRGQPVLAVTRYIEDPDWVLVAKIDKDEAFSSLIQLRMLLIKVLAVSIVVVLFLSFLLAKSIVEPLKKLTSLASNIGSGIFSQTSGILQNDEIGKLGDEINLMAVKLNNSQTKLREENEHRKRVEEALRESEHKFSKLFKSSPAGMVITTVAEGSVFDLNDSFERITGYGREESLGCTSLELGFWPKPEDHLKATGLLREYGVFRQEEYAYRHKSGEIKTGLMSAEIIEIQNISFIFTSIEDITERTLMEATIRQNEEKFRQFFENEPAYCYMITPEGYILDINKAALDVLGYDKEEIIGQPLKMIYAPESLPQMERNMITWQRSGSLKDEEMTIITKAGNKHTVLLSADAV
ncbi:MAG: PAS domain S-box protein, partial [Desulfobacula sp.]|nr:PAS domain S-box protein [Desulfobacula sp.]